MVIKTASGSHYVFVVKDGKLYFQRGLTEGVVVALSNIQIGKCLSIDYYALDMYGNESDFVTTIRTTKIVQIK